MAEPGDPNQPPEIDTAPRADRPVDPTPSPEADLFAAPGRQPAPASDWDDGVGFTSPAAMAGRPRAVLHIETPPEDALSAPMPEPVDEIGPIRDTSLSAQPGRADDAVTDVGPVPFDPPPAKPLPPLSTPPVREASLALGTPSWASQKPGAPRSSFGQGAPPAQIDGAMWAYTIYAMILFAVPTLGVSAIIGLLAVTGRSAPGHSIARSHYVYQQRTLWAAAVAALLGLILIVVNLGVFVLFLLALWLLVRGGAGVIKLKAGRPIARPRHWFI